MLILQLCLVAICFLVGKVSSHGRLMDPPSRNAMWRYGYPNPVNYNDNELYCGGFVVHYQKNGGKCGVCGDNYQDNVPRLHEAGGPLGNGIIVRRYVMGQVINISAELTTNHMGWMEAKLCPNNDPDKIVTQECLDAYPLKIVGLDHNRYEIKDKTRKDITFTWQVQLPEFLTCSQCVIQWKYFAGNTWGACEDGNGNVGCGNQETFINCADVEIYSNANVPDTSSDNPWALYFRVSGVPPEENDIQIGPTFSLRPLIIRAQLCIPIGPYADKVGMDDWCRYNCLKYPPNCDPTFCKCVRVCSPIGEFANQLDSDIYCQQHCLKHPSVCPKDKCVCN